jgi:hypothetical protein
VASVGPAVLATEMRHRGFMHILLQRLYGRVALSIEKPVISAHRGDDTTGFVFTSWCGGADKVDECAQRRGQQAASGVVEVGPGKLWPPAFQHGRQLPPFDIGP